MIWQVLPAHSSKWPVTSSYYLSAVQQFGSVSVAIFCQHDWHHGIYPSEQLVMWSPNSRNQQFVHRASPADLRVAQAPTLVNSGWRWLEMVEVWWGSFYAFYACLCHSCLGRSRMIVPYFTKRKDDSLAHSWSISNISRCLPFWTKAWAEVV